MALKTILKHQNKAKSHLSPNKNIKKKSDTGLERVMQHSTAYLEGVRHSVEIFSCLHSNARTALRPMPQSQPDYHAVPVCCERVYCSNIHPPMDPLYHSTTWYAYPYRFTQRMLRMRTHNCVRINGVVSKCVMIRFCIIYHILLWRAPKHTFAFIRIPNAIFSGVETDEIQTVGVAKEKQFENIFI